MSVVYPQRSTHPHPPDITSPPQQHYKSQPEGWLDDEPDMVPDPEAAVPDDWWVLKNDRVHSPFNLAEPYNAGLHHDPHNVTIET